MQRVKKAFDAFTNVTSAKDTHVVVGVAVTVVAPVTELLALAQIIPRFAISELAKVALIDWSGLAVPPPEPLVGNAVIELFV